MKQTLLPLLAAAALMGATSTANANTWVCEINDTTKKVILSQESDPALSDDQYVSGMVTGPYGKKYTAKVSIDGFDRRWDYATADKTGAYAVVISTSGRARFYDLSEILPRYYLLCQESKTKAKLHTDEKSTSELLTEENQRGLNSLSEAYKLAILKKVKRNWIRPAGSKNIPECWVRVLQGPGGIILDITFDACKGSTGAYRSSIENAVYKAEPLPKPGDPSLFERELKFNFKPE